MERRFEKKHNNKSDVARFHDQKSADFDEKTMVVLESGTEKHSKFVTKNEQLKRDAELGSNSIVEKHLRYVLNTIEEIELDPLYSNDKTQQELLERKKAIAKDLIYNVLIKVEEYLKIINRMGSLKIDKDNVDPETYQEELENIEKIRTINHNALITEINIVNRFLKMNFGNVDEEILEQWEEKEEEAGREVLYAKRVELPQKGICVDAVDMSNRKSITDWAFQISKSITYLKNDLKRTS